MIKKYYLKLSIIPSKYLSPRKSKNMALFWYSVSVTFQKSFDTVLYNITEVQVWTCWRTKLSTRYRLL